MKKKKRAFTLLELMAVIVILAFIALITVPNVSKHITYSKTESLKQSIKALARSYEYKELESNIELGRKDACEFQNGTCKYMGYIDRDSNGKTIVYISSLDGCISGYADDPEITNTICGIDDVTPPIISNVEFDNLTTSSVDIIVKIQENESLIKSSQFRLLDKNGNTVLGWTDADNIYEANNFKIVKKSYKNLKLGTEYNVELKVVNTSKENNTITALFSDGKSYKFKTLDFDKPVITYDTTKWETKKIVTITYPIFDGLERKYRVLSNNLYNPENFKEALQVQTVEINKNNYFVQASAKSGSTILTNSSQIGFIDNEKDVNNTKPTSSESDYKNENRINTDEVTITLNDTLSGVAYYCISTTNNSNNCEGIGTNADLNKWVLAVNSSDIGVVGKEKLEVSVQHKISEGGTYYSFTKDAVGNISDGHQFTVYKVSYKLNNGTGEINHQIKLKDNDLVLTDIEPQRDGYIFLGWDENANAHTDNPTYLKKGTYTSNKNVTLYAQWRKTITITYNANQGEGTVENSVCYMYNADEKCTMHFNTNNYTRTGYTFKRWSKQATGEGEISYNQNAPYEIGESETVYAGWEAKELTFNDQNYLNNTFNTQAYTIEITKATNGNYATQYTKQSEKKGNENTNYITVNGGTGALTVAASTPVGEYEVEVEAKLPVEHTINSITEVKSTKKMKVKVNSYNISSGASNPGTTGLVIEIANVANQTYNGSAITPKPVVKLKTSTGTELATLSEGTDFDYSYTNNTNVGTATITVTGKGNYSGIFTKNFTIVRRAITINAGNQTVTYGTDITRNTNQVSLASGSSYGTGDSLTNITLTESRTTVGTGTITPSAATIMKGTTNVTSNYSISYGNGTLTINAYDLSGATIASVPDKNYTGTAHEPHPAVTALGKTLSEGTDFDYSYTNNTNAGTAIITITGKGNFTGTKTQTFKINSITGNQVITCATPTFSGSSLGLISTVNVNNGTLEYKMPGGSWTNYYVNGGPTAVNAGSYTISWRAYEDNYKAFETTTTCTISPMTLTIPGDKAAITYNGQGQNSGVSCPTGSTASGDTNKTYVGSYKHRCSLNNGNYIWNNNTTTYKDINWSISARAITIKAANQTVSYGTDITNNTSQVSLSSGSYGTEDGLTSILLSPSTSSAGTGTITPSNAVIKKGSTDVTSNYSIDYATGVLTINKIDATCPSVTGYSGTYDGGSHTITVSNNHAGGTVQYRTSTSESWSNNKPSRIDVGTTTVYIQVLGDSNHNTKACSDSSISISNANLSGSVTITGTNTAGKILTANVTNTNSASLSYQWYANNSPISGATSSTFTVATAQVGQTIKVIVTATKANYNSNSWEDTTDAATNGTATAKAGYTCPSGTTTVSNSTLGSSTDGIICTVPNVGVSRCVSVPTFADSDTCAVVQETRFNYSGCGSYTGYTEIPVNATWTHRSGDDQLHYCGDLGMVNGRAVKTTETENAAKANCNQYIGKTVYNSDGISKYAYDSTLSVCTDWGTSSTYCSRFGLSNGYWIVGRYMVCHENASVYTICPGCTSLCNGVEKDVNFACSSTVTEYECPANYTKASNINTSDLVCYKLPEISQ